MNDLRVKEEEAEKFREMLFGSEEVEKAIEEEREMREEAERWLEAEREKHLKGS